MSQILLFTSSVEDKIEPALATSQNRIVLDTAGLVHQESVRS